MTDTLRLTLPLLAQGQAQKHVTHNEALLTLDAVTQLAVTAMDVDTPPASPIDGECVLIGQAPTGVFAGHAGDIAERRDGAWCFHLPRAGWRAYFVDEAQLVLHDGANWVSLGKSLGTIGNLAGFGLAALPDAANAFVAKVRNALFTAPDPVDPDAGDCQIKLNRTGSGNVGSLLFQTGYSGRAEVGFSGDDTLRLRVSADGATWRDAFEVDGGSGQIGFPLGGPARNLLINGAFQIWQRGVSFASSGQCADRWRADLAGSGLVQRVASGLPQGVRHGLAWDSSATGAMVELRQALETDHVIPTRGRQVTFSIEIAANATFSGNVTCAVESCDTADVLTSGIWTTLATISPAPDATWQRVSVTATVPVNANGLRIRITTASGQASGARLLVARARLDHGPFVAAALVSPNHEELAQCRRYFMKSYDLDVLPGANNANGAMGTRTASSSSSSPLASVTFPVAMRAVPIVTLINPVTGSTTLPIRNFNLSTDHAGIVIQGGESGFFCHVNGSAIAASTRIYAHFTADAELP